MAASDSVNDVAGWVNDRLADASPDLLRAMIKQFAETLMAAEADAMCGAGYRERSAERVNSRNGYLRFPRFAGVSEDWFDLESQEGRPW